jgi:hypothetical protein
MGAGAQSVGHSISRVGCGRACGRGGLVLLLLARGAANRAVSLRAVNSRSSESALS